MLITKISPRLIFRGNDFEKNRLSEVSNAPVSPCAPICGGGGDSFVRHNTSILDVTTLKQLDIPRFRLVDSNSVRGMCLSSKPIEIFEGLRDAGIETVIDLRQEGRSDSRYAEKCQRVGLDYINFKVKENMFCFNNRGATKFTSTQFNAAMDDFVGQLARFFDAMGNGRVYIGCLLGLHRTDLAVSMNYLLNPTEPQSPPILSHMFYKEETNFTNKRIASVKNLYNNLTPKHKQILHLPEDFRDILSARITKLRMMNLAK